MIALWIACGLLVMGFAAVLLRFIFLKRDIRQMGRKLSTITEADTNEQLKTSTFDADVVTLVGSINKSLEKNRQDFHETRRIEADLKRAITNISHDLRTPLTSAKGYLQMVENGQLDKQTLSRYITVIGGRLDALTTLMDNLFSFSRAMEGDITLQSVNVGNTLRDTLVANFTELERRGFTVESNIPDSPIYCLCDEDALKRVVQNLVSNAIIHGNSYLHVQLSDGKIAITNKTDNIHQINTHDIFERFYTADTSRTNKRTGLGLAIAKELTEKMGGYISVTKDEDMITMCVHLSLA